MSFFFVFLIVKDTFHIDVLHFIDAVVICEYNKSDTLSFENDLLGICGIICQLTINSLSLKKVYYPLKTP